MARRLGCFTKSQLDYMQGKKIVNKDRRRVEDFYIKKSFEETLKQLKIFADWEREPEFKRFLKALRKSGKFQRDSEGNRYLQQKFRCPNPNCNALISFLITKDGKLYATSGTFGTRIMDEWVLKESNTNNTNNSSNDN
jgi:hypothetical protein